MSLATAVPLRRAKWCPLGRRCSIPASRGDPVYAAADNVHDYVVQAKGAFDETVLGILKLKDRGQRVEMRMVLHAITAPRIAATSRWLARNLPFVDHVALMGLENTGFAIANDKLLWIDPMDYRDQLAEAVAVLAAVGFRCPSTTFRDVCFTAQFGPMRRNPFPIGRTIFYLSATGVRKSPIAAAFSRRVGPTTAAVLSPYWTLSAPC